MKTIDIEMGFNFMNDDPASQGATQVLIENGQTVLKLHGSTVALKEANGDIYIQNGGYKTGVTKARLNGVLDAIGASPIKQKSGDWILNGEAWEGELIKIN